MKTHENYMPNGHGVTEEERSKPGWHDALYEAPELEGRLHHHIWIEDPALDNSPDNVVYDDNS